MWEPFGLSWRPFRMTRGRTPWIRHLSACFAAAVMLVGPGLSARAQTGIQVDATAGIGGYAAPNEPLVVSVTVNSEVLFAGEIELNASGALIRVPAEVPAGSTKTFDIIAPPFAGQVTRVRLYATGVEVPVATTVLQLRLPGDDLLVGVHGFGNEVVQQLGRVRTDIADVPVQAIGLSSLSAPFDPLGYVVAGELGDDPGPLLDWVDKGGRLITTDGVAGLDIAGGSGLRAAGRMWGGTLYGYGDGEILMVDDIADLSDSWSSVLRPIPVEVANRDPWQTPERALAQAASNSGGSKAQSLPWLLAAMAGYALLVGPVNLVVLRRIKRRELAWITIPAISLVAVAGFYLAGRQRLTQTETTHATVIVASPTEPDQRSVVVLAAGKAGPHDLGFADGTLVYPTGLQFFDVGQGLAGVGGRVSGSTVTFDLPQLGFGAVQVLDKSAKLPEVRVDGNKLIVANDSSVDFWAWGAGGANRVPTATDRVLPAGGSDTIALPNNGGFFGGMNLGDQVVQNLQLWDDQRSWQLFYPLGEAATYLTADDDLYFYGFVEDYPIPVTLDGIRRVVIGPALIVVPVEGTERSSGQTAGRLLSAGNDGFVENGGPGFFFVSGTEMFVEFDLPTDLAADPKLRFRNDFGPAPASFQVWDWSTGEYSEVDIGQAIDRARFVSPLGGVVMRAGEVVEEGGGDGKGNFIPEAVGMSPSSLLLEWTRT